MPPFSNCPLAEEQRLDEGVLAHEAGQFPFPSPQAARSPSCPRCQGSDGTMVPMTKLAGCWLQAVAAAEKEGLRSFVPSFLRSFVRSHLILFCHLPSFLRSLRSLAARFVPSFVPSSVVCSMCVQCSAVYSLSVRVRTLVQRRATSLHRLERCCCCNSAPSLARSLAARSLIRRVDEDDSVRPSVRVRLRD